ncbi:MAG: hypothetical protein ACR2QA_13495 [Solirubrobacteraceae bacterium]
MSLVLAAAALIAAVSDAAATKRSVGGPIVEAAGTNHPAAAGIVVTPATGSTRTRFTVRFRARLRTGPFGSDQRRFELTATRGTGAGCASSVSAQVPRSRRNALISISLSPTGGRWCPGMYHGRIEEVETVICHGGEGCPDHLAVRRAVGKFSFRVRGSTGASDTTAPDFAGLQRAFACTPGAQRPGQTTPYTLAWSAASDNVTPSSQVIYDVFMSSTTGAEDFSRPSWTTLPGRTTFTTLGLASHGTFYFVVRARDRAGNEDANTVERRGLDPCY